MPVYQRLYDDLRHAITSGAMPPGTKLRSEAELAKQYELARGSVRQAIAQLSNEGLVKATAGRGTFVAEHVVLTYYGTRLPALTGNSGDGYMTNVELEGRKGRQSLEVRMVPADADRARRLWVHEGDTLVERRLLRYVDDKPWSLQVGYYPMRVAEGTPIMAAENVPEGTTKWMADHGLEQVGRIDEITARPPSVGEAATLQMSKGVPLIVLLRTAYTVDQPVRVTETLFPADRNRLLYELGELHVDPNQGMP
ncbi:GntR family transcriptional regulator [Jiangella rhizosphaerae]|uniref:GntR family transcriptional regulator n=1 Tax=Jiangella rhizosphaerae TaxID=2293569 RepID=A0A418KTP0_9ACTN|nr:GntR family transcriptional regulator [Jiangella rhizosphaerae]RIQ29139.1 GntR family transcriptional regulator [Jiangella rhizosphaerae]